MRVRQKNRQPNQLIKPRSLEQPSTTTFSDHVTELRRRGLWVGIFFIVFSAAAYSYHEVLLKIIMTPLKGEKLIYLTPGGGFSFIFLVSMYTGLLVTIPILIYHLHAFIKPALPLRARRSAFKIILATTLLVLGGVTYGYFIAIPAALQFLTTFAGDAVTPNLTADSYLNFFLAYIAGLAVLSLLPLILMFVHWIKPIKPSGLFKSERWVILFAFVSAALITPTPDIVNQAMIALPVIGIYQLGVISVVIATLNEKRNKKISLRKRASQEKIVVQEKYSNIPMATSTIPVQASEVVTKSATVSMNVAPAQAVQSTPPRIIRSLDGFRSPQIHVAPRIPVHTQKRSVIYPTRTSIDGIMIRRSRMPQN